MDNIIAFQKWLDSDNKSFDEGFLLSTFRKQEMLKLFKTNPEKAWSFHIKKSKLTNIHPDILANIENYVQDKGNLLIYNECECHGSEVLRKLKYNNKVYNLYTWGKRLNITSKKDIPFHAIILENEAVLYKKSFATNEEVAAQLAIDPNFETNIVKSEKSGSFYSFSDLENPYTTGNKRILYIRANFKGETGDVLPLEQAKAYQSDVEKYYKLMSKGKFTLTHTFTDVIELPHEASYYDFYQVLDWAALTAKDLNPNWNFNNYDFYIVVTRNPGQFGYAGRAWIGAPGHHLINQWAIFKVAAHELGHNLGLYHASSWIYYESLKLDPIGDGWVQAYGHNFSVMNSNYNPEFYDPNKPFLAPAELNYLGWANESQGDFVIVGADEDRVIKIRPLESNEGIRAVKIEKISTAPFQTEERYYWLCYRYHFNDNSKDGAQIDWVPKTYGMNGVYGVVEIDMAREMGENQAQWDKLLKENRTFLDSKAKVKIYTLKVNKDPSDPYIEVRVQTDSKITGTPPIVIEPPVPPVIIVDPKIKSIQVRGEYTQANQIGLNLIDGRVATKWLDWSQNTWFQINYTGDVLLKDFSLTSAEDEKPRDPHTIKLSISGQQIAAWENIDWNNRNEVRKFIVPSGAVANSFKFDLISNSNITQLAEYISTTEIPPLPPLPIPSDKQYFPTNDSYTDETAPKSNVGQKWDLFVKAERKYQRISYLAFNLEPYSAEIKSVKLYLSTRIDRKNYNKPLTLDIYESAAGWKEDKISWITSPTLSDKIVSYTLTTSEKKIYEIDLTEFIKAKIKQGQYEFSFAIKAATPIEYIAKIDAAESIAPPKLVVSFK